MIRFQVPFAVFLGDIDDESSGKTGLGLVQWRREDCAGQIRLPACRIDTASPISPSHRRAPRACAV